ncbi:hypothetical protein K505DRAFT_206165, partial [Melanomma pulvis-pyrius CBS 109.77]
APAGKKASKPFFKTDIPFTETQWPQTAHQDQKIILDLLCNLVEPLGHYRETHLPPSKGTKRKRHPPSASSPDTSSPPPAPPALTQHLLIGLNSITRHLSTLAAANAPSTTRAPQLQPSPPAGESVPKLPASEPKSLPKITLLILPTLTPSTSLAHAHLPTLLYLSSKPSTVTTTPSTSPSPSPSPRLVTLPPSSEARIASALHIPRVGAIAVLEGAPGADTLVQYVREKVGVVECAWVEEGMRAEWRGVKGS